MLINKVFLHPSSLQEFPYHLAMFKTPMVDFHAPVTFLVGDNGSGKSTFLELMNGILGLPRIGEGARRKEKQLVMLNAPMTLEYSLKRPRGFYFDAADFSVYLHDLAHMKKEATQDLIEAKKEYKNRSILAQNQALEPHLRTLGELENQYERNLNASSHGESFMAVFKERIHQHELYLMDEPETPLSFHNLLGLLILIDDAVKQGNQLIIATHSPVLLAYPKAEIYEFSSYGINKTSYKDLESVQLLKDFLNTPELFLSHLFRK